MSDETPRGSGTDPADTTNQPPADSSGSQGETAPNGTEIDWKARAREWERRAKANADAAKKLTQIEEAQKTDEQRRTEQLDQALARATRAENDLARERVARRYGLDDELLPFLTGDTDDELEARAKVIAERLGDRQTTESRRPDHSQGRGSDAALNGDPLLNDLKAKLGIP